MTWDEELRFLIQLHTPYLCSFLAQAPAQRWLHSALPLAPSPLLGSMESRSGVIRIKFTWTTSVSNWREKAGNLMIREHAWSGRAARSTPFQRAMW